MICKNLRWVLALVLASNLAVIAPGTLLAGQPGNASQHSWNSPTTTPIKHVIVIFQENVSFDHYFATTPSLRIPTASPVSSLATALYSPLPRSTASPATSSPTTPILPIPFALIAARLPAAIRTTTTVRNSPPSIRTSWTTSPPPSASARALSAM